MPEEPFDVVIVDDADAMRLLLRRILQRDARFRVVDEAADGRAAIASAQRHKPRFMLLDLKMPGMDGDAALPHILAASPGTRVVIVSGLDKSVMAERTAELGAADYVEKDGVLIDLPERLLRLA